MRREDYVFCIGYEGSTAIVDGRMKRRYGHLGTAQLAEAGLFKQAVCAALWSGSPEELQEVLSIFNAKTATPARTADELTRIFGTFGVPEGVKKVTVV
ncbi:MAG TPA: hypothetical protein VMM82_11390 [Spirochaetia bacterium]|nr:hypothetical protein [Spirochaetia bacterium]